MLDYLISILNFTVNGQTYNLITTPWSYLIDWRTQYIAHASQGTGAWATAVRDADEVLLKYGLCTAALVVVLIIICAWWLYKIASGFTGWFKFR